MDCPAMNTETNFSTVTEGQDPLHLLNSLYTLWTKKDIQKLRETATSGFAALKEPLDGILIMLENCGDLRKGKGHSLGHYIVTEFQDWIRTNPVASQTGMALKQQQCRAFTIVIESQANLLEPLISVYQLDQADRAYLLEQVSYLSERGRYKEAALLAIKLNLQKDLNMEEICTPLILQDKANIAEAFVANEPDLQRRLVQMLDSWCDSSFNTKNFIRKYQGTSPLKTEKMNHKVLGKLVFRLLELYDIDPALCPNVVKQRHFGTLKFLLYRRFVEKDMTEENWADHIEHTVGQNRWLQDQLVNQLVRYDLRTAARWAYHYKLPLDTLPYEVAVKIQEMQLNDCGGILSRDEHQQEGLEDIENDYYYQLPLPLDRVCFVGTLEELQQCKSVVLQPGQVVGIDMEWRPSFGVLGKSRVALMQLAVRDQVFLLDLPELLKKVETANQQEEFSSFIQTLFTDSSITKLGYGMSGDLRSLATTYPVFASVMQHMQGLVELLSVHQQLQKRHSNNSVTGSRVVDVLSATASCQGRVVRQPEKGLSLLVQHVMGKPLNKTEQLSNWEKRPLRKAQIVYAAIDAYCLLDVYNTLLQNPDRFGVDLQAVLLGKQGKTSKEEKAKSKQKTHPTPAKEKCESSESELVTSSSQSPIAPKEFHVICDNMLQGLGRYLRCLGVDVKMLENDDDHRKAAEIARTEGRVILTCGLPYQTLRSQVGEGRCFSVPCSEKAKDQAVRVLKHFNVLVTPADIFSRCQNGDIAGSLKFLLCWQTGSELTSQ
ncbi:exonuclease mut-7 homolog [Protopterus annectens]|uniref:exonuclease mut-7 homolog n=1 Tax=Protopterus annectens TaxID=7888 RepID=UPI001CFA8B8E|nr:exonuclease mut-7 homolog [Protopterus annectens]